MPSLLPALRSSAGRLAQLYLFILVATLSVVLGALYLVSQGAITREADVVVQAEGDALREEFEFGGLPRLTEVLNRRVDDWGRIGAVYLLVNSSGEKLAGNLSGWPQEVEMDGQWLQFKLSARVDDANVDHPVRASILNLSGNRLLVGTDVSEQVRVGARQRAAALWGIVWTALLAALAGWWYSRRVGARVRGVAVACEDIMAGQWDRRLPHTNSRDEFDQLTGVVNQMLDRVDHQSSVLRTTFRSAAHDLRTPLQRVRMRLESGAQDDIAAPLRAIIGESVADIERVQRTLATLLQIAHVESGTLAQDQMQDIDLAGLARELVDLYQPVAAERGLQLTMDAPAAATLSGNRQLLAQLVVNLLENALKFVPNAGQIQVSVAVDGDFVRLRVGDNGPGIPAARRSEALRPFMQLRQSDALAGSGLGLSLVAAVVHIHHGELLLSDNRPGLVVSCSFRRI
jgi:signal transduction histidine kinase